MDDWSARIKELEACGLSLTEIGVEVGLSTSSVSDIKRGASKAPNGMAAVRLYNLHRDRCDPLADDSKVA